MSPPLNPYFRFDTMVVGAANRLAVTAARAVAETPGAVYNPLFIYARPGLGKTHLLMAMGHGAKAIDPALSVEYLTLDHFIEAFHAAIASGQGEAYRKRFADVSLLLVDDVQFLTGQREAQAELLRIVDAMQTASRQIVLTSDRPPSEIEALDERLIRRFAGGLVIDISPPDYETKVAILRRKAEERRVTLVPGVLEAVAKLGLDNVRELVGALNRLIAHQAAGDDVPAERVEALLGGGVPASAAAPAASGGSAPVEPPSSANSSLRAFCSLLRAGSSGCSLPIGAFPTSRHSNFRPICLLISVRNWTRASSFIPLRFRSPPGFCLAWPLRSKARSRILRRC